MNYQQSLGALYTQSNTEFKNYTKIYRMLQNAIETEYININCVDPLGRSALLMAIDNENLEMVELLINYSVDTKDALLHAISEEFVEAVEMLLDHEDTAQTKEGNHVSFNYIFAVKSAWSFFKLLVVNFNSELGNIASGNSNIYN